MFSDLIIFLKHDNYITGIQKLLKTTKKFTNPNFASAFIIELRRDDDNNYYVRVLYKNENYPHEPIQFQSLTIKGNCL